MKLIETLSRKKKFLIYPIALAAAVEMANLKKAKVNLELAENNVRRFRELAGKNLVSKLEAEQYENSYQVAKEEVARCAAAVESARMGQKANRAGLGVARSKVADTLIYAPQDGVIISSSNQIPIFCQILH